MSDTLLNVKNLKLQFDTEAGIVQALDGVTFDIKKNEAVGIVKNLDVEKLSHHMLFYEYILLMQR